MSWRRLLALTDPAVRGAALKDRQAWFKALRDEAIDCLDRNEIAHGRMHDVPAWYVYPHLSVWAVESAEARGFVGWWVISGDCPTDYVPCTGDRTPRAAVEEIAARWREASDFLAKGEQHPDFDVGGPRTAVDLAPLLSARAHVLECYLQDDERWQ